MKAEDAAAFLQEKRGHVVIGYPPNSEDVPVGTALIKFCGGPLVSHCIVVSEPTDREDWDEQIVALMVRYGAPVTARNPRPTTGQKFFRCRLEPITC